MNSDTSLDRYLEDTCGNDGEQDKDPVALFESVKAVMFNKQKAAMNGVDYHHKDFKNRADNFQSQVNLIQDLLFKLEEAIEVGEPEELWATRVRSLSIPSWFNQVDHILNGLRQSYRRYETFAIRLHAIRQIGEDSGFTEIMED